MKVTITYIAILVSAIFITAPAKAENLTLKETKVKEIRTLQNGNLQVLFENDLNEACTSGGLKALLVAANEATVSSDGLKAMHATLLTAFAGNFKVSVSYDNATKFCYARQIRISR